MAATMSRFTSWLDNTFYPEYSANWDDERFRARLLRYIGPESCCLDYGAGRGHVKQMNFRGRAARICGVDVDPIVLENPFLDAAATLDPDMNRIPYADSSFDVVFADNVMEHVEDPMAAMREIHRVLKPGGLFLAKTPNKWHYMPIIARLTPTGFHRVYNRWRGRQFTDTFPTRYRCNTGRAVRRYASATGFNVRSIEFIEGRPEYLRLLTATYIAGWAYERLVNTADSLASIRCVIIFELEKPKSDSRPSA